MCATLVTFMILPLLNLPLDPLIMHWLYFVGWLQLSRSAIKFGQKIFGEFSKFGEISWLDDLLN